MGDRQRFDFFSGSSKHHVANSIWQGTSQYPLHAIEADTPSVFCRAPLDITDEQLRSHDLGDAHLRDWLKGDKKLRTSQGTDPGDDRHTIRLLLCQTTKAVNNKICHHMSKDSFLAVQEAFRLPSRTLTSSNDQWSAQACQFVPVMDKDGKEAISLDVIIKTTNIPGLMASGLSLTYDFADRRTTAFAYGFDAVRLDEGPVRYKSLSQRFRSDLGKTMPLWQHPLLLPVSLLKQELGMIRMISRQQLRSDNQDIWGTPFDSIDGPINSLLVGNGAVKGPDAEKLDPMKNLNSLICASINIRLAVQTARKCAAFLLGVLDGMADLRVEFAEPARQRMMNQQIKDIINCLDNEASRLETGNDGILATMQVQLTAMSTYASQLDNVRSAHLAAQSGLDAVAMKTLAVVTAVFLPATFLATLFSMTMFNWQAGPAGASNSVVSDNFWIYWAIAIPLTVIVIGLCSIFWRMSRRTYLQKVRSANSMAGLYDLLNEQPLRDRLQTVTKSLGKRSWPRNYGDVNRDFD